MPKQNVVIVDDDDDDHISLKELLLRRIVDSSVLIVDVAVIKWIFQKEINHLLDMPEES